MTGTSTAVAALLGLLAGLGLLILVRSAADRCDPREHDAPTPGRPSTDEGPTGGRATGDTATGDGSWWPRSDGVAGAAATRGGAAVAAAAVVGAWTRWPVGAVLAGVAVYLAPHVLGGDRTARQVLARTEAVAAWTEMLRDSLSAAAGLEQTVLLTAPFVPPALADEVAELAAALRAGRPLTGALERFAAQVRDPTGRLVARALVQAGRSRSRQLPDLLSELARRARARADLQLRTAPGHARVRTNARIIVGFTLVMATGLVVLDRSFLRPYDSATGQLVLLVVGLLFAAGFTGLARLARLGLPTADLPSATAPASSPPPASGPAPTSGPAPRRPPGKSSGKPSGTPVPSGPVAPGPVRGTRPGRRT